MQEKSSKKLKSSTGKQLLENKYQICRSDDDVALIERLAEITGVKQSVLYRQAVISYYRMHVLNEPTCANGHVCKCPQFWQGDQQRSISELLEVEVPRKELGE